MSYQVLARKWRPQIFSDVVGQEHVLTALANGLNLGRLHHAYLFSGTRGVGKTSIARLFAKGLNCETGITASPCGQCDNCVEIEQGRFIDLIEIDAASRTRVEDTRELLDNVQYAPVRGRFKVYLIDEVHMLSRHSFNALLKTLEEPPEHVKFLLATTDPHKLPVTILSRCLQFHLKALDTEQIQQQLAHILKSDSIHFEQRALPLLARAAQGSLRDALSLLDQAIAAGEGQVTDHGVMQMLGTLDDEQPLGLVSAIMKGDGEKALSLVAEAASRATEWDALLAEMLRIFHTIAMLQLLPDSLNDAYRQHETLLRDLARRVPPEDLQLYYQIILTGRKELPLAPEARMGIEMTLLRALAFHPLKVTTPKAEISAQQNLSVQEGITSEKPVIPSQPIAPPAAESVGNDATSQLLQARTALLRQGASQAKKSEPVASSPRPAKSALERLATITERKVSPTSRQSTDQTIPKKESYRWTSQRKEETIIQPVATPKALRSALEHEKNPELMQQLIVETCKRDPWAAQIADMALPKLVQQLALNSWKQQVGQQVIIKLRTQQKHLNSSSAQQILTKAFHELLGETVELTIESDDNSEHLTPLEWRQVIYEERLLQAKRSVINDSHIQTLCKMFDAEVDEESIRPI
ncbi:DNA polymerase III subunit gamma/tau [Rosenbergiella australiborealis]|uniref:DNA polymerase III subunit gamma/tau n=1 Tax=Rosenbergiella australiborealis TaxID=1544696 RepID=A0ABS5T9K8_9GAMM|nr:DNA polymerase III subunit gamma/tau [Rosenbergiella australiborealis]MBT0728117.1 DNA polymerase III subunit gamma/tau [Rosenbergiella australiborealis]